MYVRTYTHTQLYVNTNISDGTRTCVLFKCWLTPFQHFKFIHTVIAAYVACVRVCVHAVACTECACVGNSRPAEMNFLSLVCFCHKDIHTASLISWLVHGLISAKNLKLHRGEPYQAHIQTHTLPIMYEQLYYMQINYTGLAFALHPSIQFDCPAAQRLLISFLLHVLFLTHSPARPAYRSSFSLDHFYATTNRFSFALSPKNL